MKVMNSEDVGSVDNEGEMKVTKVVNPGHAELNLECIKEEMNTDNDTEFGNSVSEVDSEPNRSNGESNLDADYSSRFGIRNFQNPKAVNSELDLECIKEEDMDSMENTDNTDIDESMTDVGDGEDDHDDIHTPNTPIFPGMEDMSNSKECMICQKTFKTPG